MKVLSIGILGCPVFNPNMGCAALQYSLILLLEKIRKKANADFHYYVFEYDIEPKRKTFICKELGLDTEKCDYIQSPIETTLMSLKQLLKKIYFFPNNTRAYSKMKKCDVIIDLSQGDSFSDIYGEKRFYEWARIKKKVQKLGIPLVLGPQTYGPFFNEAVKKYSAEIIKKSALVISRDKDSKEAMMNYTNIPIIFGTDLAFRLPYHKHKHNSKLIKIGINPSGLLGKKKNDLSELKNDLRTDYDDYIRKLVAYLVSEKRYEVHMISHVGNEAKECFGGFSNVIYHDAFMSPIEAKDTISGMDVFIGARMHATIAAFSSGVATIPTAYSRKFKGVFSAIGYDRVIDLCEEDTETALNKTILLLKSMEK